MSRIAASLRNWLSRPMAWNRAAALILLVMLAATIHCLAYAALLGRQADPLEATAWSIVNLMPFLIAFELGKSALASGHRRATCFKLAALACGELVGSILIQLGLRALFAGAGELGLGFEAVRRLPGIILLGCAWLAGVALPQVGAKPEVPNPEAVLLASRGFDWLRAAGNYVEVPVEGRRIMVRLTMHQAEAMLVPRGFVRVHRSALVRAAAVAAYRAGKEQDEIVMRCGTTFKVGEKYRAESTARFLLPRVA